MSMPIIGSNATVKSKQRNSTIELLRFLFMFLIVVYHAYYHGCNGNRESIYALGANPATAFHLCIFSLGKLGVTGFMFISGYYGIRMNRKKWTTLLAIMAFYFIVMATASGNYGNRIILHLARAFDEWWFMDAYLFICLLSPFIEEGIKKINQRTFLFIVIGCLYYTYIAHFIGAHNDHNVAQLLTVYLTARYINSYPPLLLRYVKLIFPVSILLLCLVPIVISMLGISWTINERFVSSNNFLLLTAVGSLMIWLEHKHTYIPLINYLSSSVAAIYLITDFWWTRQILDPWLLQHILHGWGFVYVLLVCLGCVLIDKVRAAFFHIVVTLWHKVKRLYATRNC